MAAPTLVFTNQFGEETIGRVQAAGSTFIGSQIDSTVVLLSGAGAPVNGTTGLNVAGPGSLYIALTGANLYIQTSLISTPVWKLFTRAP